MVDMIRRRRGTALLVVLALLAVLALLGMAMLILSATDRSVSVNYMDQVRAGQLARSGVEAAVAALAADPFNPDLRYWGNDENEDGLRSRQESAEGAEHVHDVPLDFAQNPSLAVEKDGDPASGPCEPRKYTVVDPEGRTAAFGVSGIHTGSTYGLESDVYQVRIMETSGCLHLNDGAALHGGNQSSVSQNLKRLLNVLGNLSTVAISQLGDRILRIRPPGGFNSITDLERRFTREELARIRPFVAVRSWVDKNVANPVPLSSAAAGQYPVSYYRGGSEGLFRRGRGRNASGRLESAPLKWFDAKETDPKHCAIYGLDELNPSYIEIVHRAPVNINSARREVLTALLTDLQGFFIGERRSFAPYAPSPSTASDGGVAIPQKYYSWWTVRHSCDGQGQDGDEYGFIYRTQPIAPAAAGSGTTTTDAPAGVSASTLAEHIVACRERRTYGSINYAEAWFGGPFRTWTQFNRFVDNLVEAGVIRDTRPIYYDYTAQTWEQLVPQKSEAGQKFASYAIADVLKANFNPNLHLNELNPDSNLYQRVDKTDLIVHSTEFTFMPTGVYEIESLGRVLRPVTGRKTRTASLFTIEAQRRLCAIVRVFEPYRETSQRHFAGGRFAAKESLHRTNSGAALEFGPEPEVGSKVYEDDFGTTPIPTTFDQDGHRSYPTGTSSRLTGWGHEFDGYITLSTLGGHDPWNPDGVCSPHWPVGSAADHEGLHVHFDRGFDADFNSGLPLAEQGSGQGGGSAWNHPDQEGDPSGPLWTGNGIRGAHRLARSFRLPPWNSTIKPPSLAPFAPGDLRTDGLYSERNCGAAYAMRQTQEVISRASDVRMAPGNFTLHGGVLSLWIKPSFFPEHTGKARNIVSMSKYHKQRENYRSPAPFNLMFLPAHDRPAYESPKADELGVWAEPGGSVDDPANPWRPTGGPIAPSCEYRDPYRFLNIGNIIIASASTPTERREKALGVWQFRPASFMAFRVATSADAGSSSGAIKALGGGLPDIVDVENYAVTSCLNHNLHPHGLDTGSTPNARCSPEEMRPNYFEAHRWTHVLLSWVMTPPF